MHSHYTLTNQRAKDSVLAVAQPIVHGISTQHRGISISKEFPIGVGVLLLWKFRAHCLDSGPGTHAIHLVRLDIQRLPSFVPLVEHVIS